MTIRTATAALALALLPSAARAQPAASPTADPVRVGADHRSLLDASGRPFFYLADTAWELFHRLDRDEAEEYLRTRASQRFTVIQAVVLAEYGGLDQPNPYGHLPLVDRDPGRPVEAYFEHVDFVVRRAEALGLVVGMLPTWGDKWNKKWGQGPEIFTPENADRFGEFLGKRYRDRPIIWILGGDRPVESDRHRRVIRAMADGLARGDEGRHLMTFHPNGGATSAQFFPDDSWLDFQMLQSGHDRDTPNHDRIAADYARKPTRPCLDGEPGYEDHPAGFRASNGYLDAYDARKAAYWALFAGACGHTYGCHDIWQFLGPTRPAITAARTPWREAMRLPGADQMRHVRALIESRPFPARVPDQSLVKSDPGRGTDHVRATRADDGSYAFVYSASGRPFTVDLDRLSGARLRAAWYDPRMGTSAPIAEIDRAGPREFRPPTSGRGQDWILVLDDPAKSHPPAGRPLP